MDTTNQEFAVSREVARVRWQHIGDGIRGSFGNNFEAFVTHVHHLRTADRYIAAGRASVADRVTDAPSPASRRLAAGDGSDLIGADPAYPLDRRCAEAWQRRPDLRAEFGTLDAFIAFHKARGRGLVGARTALGIKQSRYRLEEMQQ